MLLFVSRYANKLMRSNISAKVWHHISHDFLVTAGVIGFNVGVDNNYWRVG
jgi:hypothetical protein